jgi:molybdopterin converting factor small subunit
MATVRIPPVLRPQTGGQPEVDAAGATVGDVLRDLTAKHPDTEAQLFGPEGDLNRYVNVYLNDEDVRVLDGLGTAVSGEDTVVILPAMAGGALPGCRSRFVGPGSVDMNPGLCSLK